MVKYSLEKARPGENFDFLDSPEWMNKGGLVAAFCSATNNDVMAGMSLVDDASQIDQVTLSRLQPWMTATRTATCPMKWRWRCGVWCVRTKSHGRLLWILELRETCAVPLKSAACGR